MIINVARKELKSMFASPMGWVILALLMFSFGTYYLNGVNDYFAVMSGAMRPAERTGGDAVCWAKCLWLCVLYGVVCRAFVVHAFGV